MTWALPQLPFALPWRHQKALSQCLACWTEVAFCRNGGSCANAWGFRKGPRSWCFASSSEGSAKQDRPWICFVPSNIPHSAQTRPGHFTDQMLWTSGPLAELSPKMSTVWLTVFQRLWTSCYEYELDNLEKTEDTAHKSRFWDSFDEARGLELCGGDPPRVRHVLPRSPHNPPHSCTWWPEPYTHLSVSPLPDAMILSQICEAENGVLAPSLTGWGTLNRWQLQEPGWYIHEMRIKIQRLF